jgi:hypothetical protein
VEKGKTDSASGFLFVKVTLSGDILPQS